MAFVRRPRFWLRWRHSQLHHRTAGSEFALKLNQELLVLSEARLNLGNVGLLPQLGDIFPDLGHRVGNLWGVGSWMGRLGRKGPVPTL